MIESTQAVSAATGGAAPTAGKSTSKSFAGELVKAAARPDGEQTTKVAGHPYSKIVNGDDKGLYLNQVADNPRQGTAFRLVERGDHVFHVYGTGTDKVIIGMTPKAPADTTTRTTT